MFETSKELKLEQIDFKWVENTDDVKQLRKGLKLLRDDGGFFPELEKEIENKLKNLDKKFKVVLESNKNIPKEEIERQKAEILNWEASINQTEKMINYSANTKKPNQKDENLIKIQNEREAESEKFKGNELMKTKDFEEAIRHYDNSIRLNPSEPTTYCNRALALIKTKKYQRALEDCETAIKIKKDYSKAYYRRAVCYLNMREFKKSWNDLIYIFKETPNSQEILAEIKSLKDKWKSELGNLEYAKIEGELDKEFEEAKSYVKSDQPILNKNDEHKSAPLIEKQHITQENISENKNDHPNKKGFKKIQIFEEEIPEDNTTKDSGISGNKNETEPEVDIDADLKKKFELFMRSGQQVKEKLKDLISKNNKKEAEEITRNCLKDCQNFIKLFKPNTKYHSEIENSINDLNGLLNSFEEKQKEPEDKKYYKTKIFSEELRENATKIAEEDFKFDDFPKSAYGFEKAFNSFKKRLDVYFSYLKYVGYKTIPELFKSNEITYNLLAGVIQAIKNYGVDNEENINFSIGLLDAISKTKNFHLLKKFLKKSDKEDLKSALETIKSKSDKLLIVNGADIEKAYL